MARGRDGVTQCQSGYQKRYKAVYQGVSAPDGKKKKSDFLHHSPCSKRQDFVKCDSYQNAES
jgi:hypothetical protein